LLSLADVAAQAFGRFGEGFTLGALGQSEHTVSGELFAATETRSHL
jgi:hypothetical protein